jgi:dolichol-phosphate mannosyltransferase
VKVTAVVPTFNEAGNIAALVRELFSQPLPGLNILIVDDASSDGSAEIADGLAAEHRSRLSVLHRQGPRGLGRAYVEGFRLALEQESDVIVQMDADFSHAPADVPRLVAALEEADVAVGSRYVEGGRLDETWGAGREALSRWANLYARSILGLRARDATAGFKAWRRSALLAIDVGRVRSNGYIFQVEMAYLSERLGLRVAEVPIYFAERKAGESKMSTGVKLEAAVGVFRILLKHGRLPRPGR